MHSLAVKSDTASVAIAAAYGHAVVPVSDRMLSLLEAPVGAKFLLEGLLRQREGVPLNIMVCEHA